MPTMEETRAQAIEATREVFRSLESLELKLPFPPQGVYSVCAEPTVLGELGVRDDAGSYRYKTQGRLDLPEGRVGNASFAEKVRDALAAGGWEPVSGFLGSVHGIQDEGDTWTVHADREHLRLRIGCYADRSYILVDILGPCLPITREQHEEYARARAENLDVGSEER